MNWAVAALIGLINVMLMRPFSRYRAWWHWLGVPASAFGYLLYAIAAAATGVASYYGAQAVGLGNGVNSLGKAALAALTGAAVLRADVGRPLGRSGENARNLAAPIISWLGTAFDHIALGKIESWAKTLKDVRLEEEAGLVATTAGRPGSRITKALLTTNVNGLSGPNSAYARGQLIGLIAYGYLESDRIPN